MDVVSGVASVPYIVHLPTLYIIIILCVPVCYNTVLSMNNYTFSVLYISVCDYLRIE